MEAILKQIQRVEARKKYYQENKGRIIERNKIYQKEYYPRKRLEELLSWFIDEKAFFTQKDLNYIKKMNKLNLN